MKMKISAINQILILFVILFAADTRGSYGQTSYVIIPGVRAGAITGTVSEHRLKRIYGRKNVKSVEVGLGEGETVRGTVIYPNSQSRRIEVVWKDSRSKKNPDFVQIYGKKSRWKTREGISLGTSLKELERINGEPFTLTGFEWDYAGTVTSWNNGKLAKLFERPDRKVWLRLDPGSSGSASQDDLNAVMGDSVFSSSDKSMQKINPKVYFIKVDFP